MARVKKPVANTIPIIPIPPQAKVPVKFTKKFNPGHYFVISEKKGAPDSALYSNANEKCNIGGLKGIQVKIDWSDLETKENVYDFSKIDKLLDVVSKHTDKHLSIEIADRSFWGGGLGAAPVPKYILDKNWMFVAKVGDQPTAIGKSMPHLDIDAFADRYINLLSLIGEKYNKEARLQRVVLIGETSIGIPKDGSGFNYKSYINNLIRICKETSQSFDQTITSIGLNYLKGGNKTYLNVIENGLFPYGGSIAWPDALVAEKDKQHLGQVWAMNNKNIIPVTPDADNTMLKYDEVKNTSDIPRVFDYYVNEFNVHQIYWQPIYATKGFLEKALLPTLEKNNWAINTKVPSNIIVKK